MAVSADTMDAVRRKLNVTWDDPGTEARIEDAVLVAGPRAASLLGLPGDHEFSVWDGALFGVFLDAVYYEFNNAADEFESNHERRIQSMRLLNLAGGDDA